ncbi:MAG TPA: peptide-methionine (S)-S-oxide reductase MsrA [Candidatus Eisenbacteria bacterium]|nr:peptide-methionine (S)-S-oxide reductase MsrA [Candidatus Eisenbacteria bacterium]
MRFPRFTAPMALSLMLLPFAVAMAAAASGPATKARIPVAPPGSATATFAGGCFWCMEPPFEALPGVISVTSGFSGGMERNPTYQDVSAGKTGHTESVQVLYDPKRITYEALVRVYWHNVDPTSGDGQFCDRGKQYRPAIFYHNATERRIAQESRTRAKAELLVKSPILVQILPLIAFYPAEDYHQDYYKKNPQHYQEYRTGCGRDRRLRQLWGDAAAHH